MLGIRYYKADSSTYVVMSVNGKIRRKGKGLSFFYSPATTSIAAIPINVQEAPFIFNLQTADFQSVTVQGEVTFQVSDAQKTAEMLNFNLRPDGCAYVSEDPLKLNDRVVRTVQALVQSTIQANGLREALGLSQSLVSLIKNQWSLEPALERLGITVLDASITAISPTPETARALEAQAREEILKQADDAIYDRRKSAVEQERTIREAELQTELFIQQKEQEIEESRIDNERTILRKQAETEQERLDTQIDAESHRRELVSLSVENRRLEADAEAYAITARTKACKELPADYWKAMALTKMAPEQLLAMSLDTLAENAEKIGELNFTPELFGRLVRKAQ